MVFSWWKGARTALFAFNTRQRASGGYVDFDWVRRQKMLPSFEMTCERM